MRLEAYPEAVTQIQASSFQSFQDSRKHPCESVTTVA